MSKHRIYSLFVHVETKDLEVLFERYKGDTEVKIKIAAIAQAWLAEEVERIKAEKAIGSLENKEKL